MEGKPFREPAIHLPTFSKMAEIARSLGLDLEDSELQAYRGNSRSGSANHKGLLANENGNGNIGEKYKYVFVILVFLKAYLSFDYTACFNFH